MKIKLEKIEIKAYHGIYEYEKVNGNNFCLDIEFDVDDEKSFISDNIEDTINYENIYSIAREEMAVRANLIESVAFRIHKTIKKSFPTIEKLKVSVGKYNPFRDDCVERVTVVVD